MWFIFIILFGAASAANTFLLNSEGWVIVGNNKIEDATHMKYNYGSGGDGALYGSGTLSNFIVGSDKLINVDSKNRDDKNLWYFKSPPIILKKQPFGMMFSIMSLSGDFQKLNFGGSIPVVKITSNDGLILHFRYAFFDGRATNINVPFVKELWENNRDFTFKQVFSNPFTLEILGDWTQRSETIGIDNIQFY